MTVRFNTTVKQLGALIELHQYFLAALAAGRLSDARKRLDAGFARKLSDQRIRRGTARLDMPTPWVIEDIDVPGGGVSKNTSRYVAFTELHVRDGAGKRWEFRPARRLEGRSWRSSWLPGMPGGK
jgi:hypothetical protein